MYMHSWPSPDGMIHDQTDHILVEKRNHSNMTDV